MIRFFQGTHFFQYSALVCLLVINPVYAVESTATPGPSVGHRVVTTNLFLGTTAHGNIALNTTRLTVRGTIGLYSATGKDADGDVDKAGAHCVWYKVDPITNVETMIKDPGVSDRNCHYTMQPGDVGFKIKNVIKIYSDQDIATAKGYTINPIESWPVETLSANTVQPVAITYLSVPNSGIGGRPNFDVDLGGRFETIIKGGMFGIDENNTTTLRSNSSAVTTNGTTATIVGEPTGEVVLTGLDVNGLIVSEFRFTPKKIFEFVGIPRTSVADLATARNECLARGMVLASKSDISIPGNFDESTNGSVFLEWLLEASANGGIPLYPNVWYRVEDSGGIDYRVINGSLNSDGTVREGDARYEINVGSLCVKNL